jgi:hypothetical protein
VSFTKARVCEPSFGGKQQRVKAMGKFCLHVDLQRCILTLFRHPLTPLLPMIRLCGLMVRKWSMVPISYTNPNPQVFPHLSSA